MKLTHLALAVAAAVALVGCDEEPSEAEKQAYVDQQAQAQVREKLAADEKELKSSLAQMKQADPTITDAYYGIGPDGQKELHVVHQQAQSSTGFQEMVWPMVGGLAVGAIAAKMLSSGGGLSGYAAANPPRSYQSYDDEERKRRRNVTSSGYAGSLMSSSRANIYSQPNFSSNMRQSVLSTRSAGSFKGAASARGGSYGFGG